MTTSRPSSRPLPRRLLLPLLIGLCLCPAVAFCSVASSPVGGGGAETRSVPRLPTPANAARLNLFSSRSAPSVASSGSYLFLRLRGGDQEAASETGGGAEEESAGKGAGEGGVGAVAMAPLSSALRSFGSAYSSALTSRPILTKSVTASVIFGLSDYSAQRIENSSSAEDDAKNKVDWTRTITSMLVGLLYFGPAAHAWYETIFRVLPGTSLVSTLQKAALGQMLFGPSFTCVFFATSLMQSGSFTLRNWMAKIKTDLPGAWAAGLGFWPFVDLVSYSLIPSRWIPLFVNFCSFVWTIYLSMVANRGEAKGDP